MRYFIPSQIILRIKAFLILPSKEEPIASGDDFLKAVVNQCEILFLLFDSQYYSSKNKKNDKK